MSQTFPDMDAAGKLQAGFSIIAAIFLLVALAALGAFMVSVGGMQHLGQAYDVQGARAYQAARAGIEWGLYQVLQVGGSCDASVSFTPAAIAGFTVTVTCSASASTNEGNPAETVTVYALAATACNQPAAGNCPGTPAANYVERRITTMVSR